GVPDLHITKAAFLADSSGNLTTTPITAPIPAGNSFFYVLTVHNAGNGPATGVVVTDVLDSRLTVIGTPTFNVDPSDPAGTANCGVGANSPNPLNNLGSTITCSFPDTPNGFSLAADDGNTTGPEPDTAIIVIKVGTPSATADLPCVF